MIWYLENLLRHRREREALDALVSSADWLVPGEWRIDNSLRLIWDSQIVVGDRTFPVSLCYPNHFPHSPPLVLPRGKPERWSSHQYGPGGELCLEFGPDNWHPDLTAADMIQSAHRLLQGERPESGASGLVPSRHSTTLGQNLRGTRTRLLVTRSLADLAAKIPDNAVWIGNVLGMFHDEAFVNVVASIVMPDGEKWVEQCLPKPLEMESYVREAVLFRWPEHANLPPEDSFTAYRNAAARNGVLLPEVNFAVLVRGSVFRAYMLDSKADRVTELAVIPPEPAAARVDQAHSQLAGRKVGIVGCGSLGSKLAVMLARAGVERFLLVDDDILFPDNFVRHDLDWRDAGTHKADSVGRRIVLVNPAAVCETRKHKLGGQEASGSVESLIEKLSECDLIVDATADPRVFNYLCAASDVGKKPFLWAEVFGGGIGGLIARHRPGLEPDPATMRAVIESWCADQGRPIERSPEDYEGRGSGPPMVADDADVTVIAAHAARLAIDTLIPRNPSTFPSSVYMIGLAEGWIFDQPFDTRPIGVGTPRPASVAEPLAPDIADEERGRALQLIKKFADAASSNPAGRQKPST